MTAWTHAAGLALIHSLWQFALIAALLWAALKLIPIANGRWRYKAALLCMYLIPAVYLGTLMLIASSLRQPSLYPPAESAGPAFFVWMVWAWAAGIAYQLWALKCQFSGVKTLRRAPAIPADDKTAAMFRDLCASIAPSFKPVLRIAECAASPCTFGWIKPVILIPAGFAARVSPQELEAILAHEIAHIKQHDFLHNILQSAIEAIFFYHPALRYISHTVSTEREHACDDLAARALPNSKPLATALVKTRLMATAGLWLAAASSEVQQLERRVQRLATFETAHYSRARRHAFLRPLLTFICVAGFAAFSWGLSVPIKAHASQMVISKPVLIDLKDQVCAELRKEDIYYNAKYGPVGYAHIRLSGGQVTMNETPLPDHLQKSISGIFEAKNLNAYNDVKLRFWGNDVKLVFDASAADAPQPRRAYWLKSADHAVRKIDLPPKDRKEASS